MPCLYPWWSNVCTSAVARDTVRGRASIPQAGRGPLTVPIWYRYEPGGEVGFTTARESRKNHLLTVGCRIILCVQTETPPYKYVSVEGPVTAIEPSVYKHNELPLAYRYLGVEMGDKYLAASGMEEARAANVLVRLRPEWWLAVDFAKVLPL